ncbi:MAG: preprotein translocase subunit SecA [Deltaproteobacteria bacterium]|nr:preprotein translocase subunit SecA [Deltaproteobacteria bacterium]
MSSFILKKGVVGRLYPEREEFQLKKRERLSDALGSIVASRFRPRAEDFRKIVKEVHSCSTSIMDLTDADILEKSKELRPRLYREGFKKSLVARSFTLIKEIARRTVGMGHFDVQLMGGWALLRGMVAEMETGEGKTLTATLPACTLALAGIPVHIITVNDYLAQRDAEWMRPIYEALGLKVGTIVHGKEPDARREAYRCDVTYCCNKELAFDYLRDRIVMWDRPSPLRFQVERLSSESSRVNRLLLRGLHFAIVDEADSVLIDEARTPLIISSEESGLYDDKVYRFAIECAKELVNPQDYRVLNGERRVEITSHGKARIREFSWAESVFHANEEQKEELLRQALVALHLFSRDKHYLIKEGKIQIIDEYTGRLMPDRSWERGLHQLLEVKEGCEITRQRETKARISYQRFFRRYLRLSGMTGTAREVAGELWSIYRVRVVSIPTNRPLQRRILQDCIYPAAEKKWNAVMHSVSDIHGSGRPVLVGTRSVDDSEHLSRLMTQAGLPHRVLNARQDQEEAEIIADAGQRGNITVATNMAGRGTDISLGKGVAELGGLHVIATERHEAGRIDRQLFGRCGRQGDPGSCEAILSLEDELLMTYIGRTVRWILKNILGKPRGITARWFAQPILRRAQRFAEKQHAGIRHDLLKMDEQLSQSLAFSGRQE